MSTRRSRAFYGVMIALSSLVVGMVLASRLGLSPASFAGSLTVPPTNSAPLTGALDATTFRTIAQEASPAVVSIRTTVAQQAGTLEDFFGFQVPPGRQQVPRRGQAPQQIILGAGSGFIIDKTGFILTNNHVVEDAKSIEVYLADMPDATVGGRGLAAKIVGTDVLTDAALIQLTELPDHPLSVARFGDSSQMAPGDWVMAIGNPFTLSNTVTVGVVSAVGRVQPTAVSQRFEEMIQTDAAINKGNSGGPLLNIRGEVVGINTQIYSDQGGGNLGIGFAVPINTVKAILPALEKGKVVRGRIGVSVSRVPMTKDLAQDLGLPGITGAHITDVGDGPAKAAGIRVDDVIVEFNGKPVKSGDDLVPMVTATTPGTTVPVKIVRAKKPLTVNVKVEELNIEAEQAQLQPQGRPNAPDQGPTDTGFGMTIEGLTPNLARRLSVPQGQGGAVVSEVDPGGPAQQAGVQAGDVILQVSGQAVSSVDQVGKALDAIPAGRTARIVVFRGGREVLALVRKR
jgi:serine protease Do